MITAKEAKALYDESGAEVDQFLIHQVEKQVAEAAKGGKRHTFILLGTVGPYEYVENMTLPLHVAIVKKLKELGYHACIVAKGDEYVPWGLANDDGNGPKHRNYGIHIGW